MLVSKIGCMEPEQLTWTLNRGQKTTHLECEFINILNIRITFTDIFKWMEVINVFKKTHLVSA